MADVKECRAASLGDMDMDPVMEDVPEQSVFSYPLYFRCFLHAGLALFSYGDDEPPDVRRRRRTNAKMMNFGKSRARMMHAG